MKNLRKPLATEVASPFLVFIAVIGLSLLPAGAAAQGPPPKSRDDFSQKRYGCIVAGAPVYAAPGSVNKKLFDLKFGEEAAVGESREVRDKNGIETWVRVKRGAAVGWIPEFELALRPPRKDDYLEQPDSLEGAWHSFSGLELYHFTLEKDGRCWVQGCETGSGPEAGGIERYTWGGEGGTIVITAFGPGQDEGRAVYEWNIRERTRFSMLVDEGSVTRELFRNSLIAPAVRNGPLNYVKALFANNRYAPADFDKHLTSDDYYDETRDPELEERQRVLREWEEEKKRRAEAVEAQALSPEEEGLRPPPEYLSEELNRPAICNDPTNLEWIRLPLLGIALSARRSREDVALCLLRQKADPNAFVKKFGCFEGEETIDEPLLVYLRRHGAAKGCDLLLTYGARPDVPDASGRTYADYTAKDAVRVVVPREGAELRDAPSPGGTVFATIPGDSEVLVLETASDETTVQGRTGRWTKVAWYYKTGWVFGGLLR